MGGRLLSQDFITVNGTAQCHKNTTGPIYEAYCNNREIATEESCAFFNANNISYFPAMPGLTSKKFFGESLFLCPLFSLEQRKVLLKNSSGLFFR